MNADVLSDVLAAVRLSGAVYFDFHVTAPWVAEAPPAAEIAAKVMPRAQRVIEFHLIAHGSCWGNIIGSPPVRFREGDLVAFPQGDPHVLSSAPGMRATPDMAIFSRGNAPLPLCFQLGADGPDRARIVCGFLGCDERPYNPLLSALPRMMHIATAEHPATAGWLATLLHLAAQETSHRRPGGENVLSRMSELIFVEAVRQYLETLPPEQTGWLSGLRDPLTSSALGAMHDAPADDWTVEQLARHVGVSRSVLAEKFTAIIGQPPMQYLALWRMQLASRLLADGKHLSAVAAAVGYESESAFSRTFKKLVGASPAAWRRRGTAA